jgi:hypothetical protein
MQLSGGILGFLLLYSTDTLELVRPLSHSLNIWECIISLLNFSLIHVIGDVFLFSLIHVIGDVFQNHSTKFLASGSLVEKEVARNGLGTTTKHW